MEEYMIDLDTEELVHWGIKGQKWGVRRYQNTDGSLKPAGRKRYGDAPDFVKKIKAKKVQKQRVKNLEKARKAKNEKKKAEEEALKKKEELLKSVDAKELYKNKHLLTNQELNDRLNRIDLENRLSSKIEPTKSGREKVAEYFDKTTKLVDSTSKLYKSIDGLVSATTGKNINKHLGIDKDKIIPFDPDDFVKNMHKLSDEEFNKKYKRYLNVTTVDEKEATKARKIKEAKEAEEEEYRVKAEEEAKARRQAETRKRVEEAARRYAEKVAKERDDKEAARKAAEEEYARKSAENREDERIKREAEKRARAAAERIYREHQNSKLNESSEQINTGKEIVSTYLGASGGDGVYNRTSNNYWTPSNGVWTRSNR